MAVRSIIVGLLTPLALLAACGFSPTGNAPPARLIAPLSTATVNVARPTLRFTLPAGGTQPIVELSRKRGFDAELRRATVDGSRTHATPDGDLEPGLWFWRVRVSTPNGPSTSPVWQLTRTAQPGAREASWGSALDVDGDGFAELAVGASDTTIDGNIGTGRVYVYAGGPDGPDLARVTVLDGPVAGGQFGHSLAAVDFDGDGFADLAVGASSEGTAGTGISGKVYVYRGGPHGLAAAPDYTLSTGDGGGVGWSLDGAGDLNGDGYGDLVAGAPLSKVAGVLTGAAYVFYGDDHGGANVATLRTSDGALAKVGLAVAGGGDLDGDGLADVIIGVPDSPMGSAGHGRAYIYRGQPIGLDDNPTVLDESSPLLAQFGSALAIAGDVDGDGLADLAVSAPGDGAGRVYLYTGRAGAAPQKLARFDGPDGPDGRFGATLSSDDVDGDGRSDLAIGATCAPPGPDCPGRAYVVLAASATFDPMGSTSVSATFTGPAASSAYGISLQLADHDGDGRADLAVGASAFQFGLGRVDWFHGGPTFDPTPRALNGVDAKSRYGVSLR